MRTRNPKRTLNFYFILCCLTLLTVTSCVFTNNQDEQSILNSVVKTENNYANIEAQLLGKFTQQNIILISLSKRVKENEIPFRVKCLATRIIEEQTKINTAINTITAKKLIIVPNISTQRELEISNKIDNLNFTNNYLSIAARVLNNQIEDLKVLSETTEDVDFKILSLQTIVKLSTTLEKIKEINDLPV